VACRLTVLCSAACGGVGVWEAHDSESEMAAKCWEESRCCRAVAAVQAACTTTLASERNVLLTDSMSLRRQLTSAATERNSSVDTGLARACSPAREASAPWEIGASASLWSVS
jgi:hypothetical protein